MSWQRWDHAWHQALYGPQGFYRQPAGPAAHFATSAQGIPGVGALLARAVIKLTEAYDVATVVEIGAGRGELLSEIASVTTHLELVGVDVVARPELDPSIRWVQSPGGSSLPDSLRNLDRTLVLAHEWLDVVPTPVAEVDEQGMLRYVEVDAAGEERLAEIVSGADLQWCQAHWPTTGEVGQRVEIGQSRDTAWADLCQRVSSGVVVAVDYGHTRDGRPPYGTLTGYRDGGQVPPVPDGSCDITTHVAVDSLAATRRLTQRELFSELALGSERPDHALASADPAAYLHALAGRSAYAAATASPGLGDFWWLLHPVG